MKNWLFATTFSINRSQRKLVTYYLTCYDKQAQTMSQENLPAEGIQMGGM